MSATFFQTLKRRLQPAPTPAERLGPAGAFVLAQGFSAQGPDHPFCDHSGRRRRFAELAADPDRPEIRPEEAYRALLASLQPGWQLRLLQIRWPDPAPRRAFLLQAAAWQPVGRTQELLRDSLASNCAQAPLPFLPRTILEFACPGEEGRSWWQGIPALLSGYGLKMRDLTAQEIADLAVQVFNPELE